MQNSIEKALQNSIQIAEPFTFSREVYQELADDVVAGRFFDALQQVIPFCSAFLIDLAESKRLKKWAKRIKIKPVPEEFGGNSQLT